MGPPLVAPLNLPSPLAASAISPSAGTRFPFSFFPSLSPLCRHEKKLDKSLEEKTIVEETAKRIEIYVQKRVRTELESETFLLALQKKIDDAKTALTEKMLGILLFILFLPPPWS